MRAQGVVGVNNVDDEDVQIDGEQRKGLMSEPLVTYETFNQEKDGVLGIQQSEMRSNSSNGE